ncbi:TraR/DksA C4-type zinc finger protein [Mesorhizobium sp.]|uniref:TraR/DksA C4-type zinc finger protein n=1 Tax=Mesorhizobium sp. TaxID=1871066 RepID=UPI000FE710E2|nr:TraR/DksA C4-type zinc finger protein [Mesorhizobium sp.]RWC58905.1 MAG: TraR/DksA family transcriptional regulator [Mesorhizobium sp.]RWC66517.1 MAG: TraR/DksA family transcriptional regulator [Mesorhizobium sp.]
MSVSNLAFELADRRAEEERAAGIRRVQQAIRAAIEVTISPFCDCGVRIPDDRRQAMPHAKRCIDCETFVERQNRRSA